MSGYLGGNRPEVGPQVSKIRASNTGRITEEMDA
jgi:hypothetical protein